MKYLLYEVKAMERRNLDSEWLALNEADIYKIILKGSIFETFTFNTANNSQPIEEFLAEPEDDFGEYEQVEYLGEFEDLDSLNAHITLLDLLDS